jgi:hypothetical protein
MRGRPRVRLFFADLILSAIATLTAAPGGAYRLIQ